MREYLRQPEPKLAKKCLQLSKCNSPLRQIYDPMGLQPKYSPSRLTPIFELEFAETVPSPVRIEI